MRENNIKEPSAAIKGIQTIQAKEYRNEMTHEYEALGGETMKKILLIALSAILLAAFLPGASAGVMFDNPQKMHGAITGFSPAKMAGTMWGNPEVSNAIGIFGQTHEDATLMHASIIQAPNMHGAGTIGKPMSLPVPQKKQGGFPKNNSIIWNP
ncbi:MAG: hypothetical protein HY917_00630 [Candidatus Diapherotrites archaeon]|nr:hypothetical protein [Candidatus Diapherotrites archaeon]